MLKQRKILLIDDHGVVRRGLAQLIERQIGMTVCGEVGTPRQALAAIEAQTPDVVVLDISLGDYSGLSLIKDIRCRREDLPILVLSMHDENLYAERVLRNGANGYIMKERAAEEVIAAINKVADGAIYLSQEMSARLLAPTSRRQSSGFATDARRELTNRELEVLAAIGNGNKTAEIAQTLHISIKTVESHRANIKRKLGLSNAIELLQYATRLHQPRPDKPNKQAST